MATDDIFRSIEDKLKGDDTVSDDQVEGLMTELRTLTVDEDGVFDRADLMGFVRQLVRKEKQSEVEAVLKHVAPDMAETKLGQNLLKGKRGGGGQRRGQAQRDGEGERPARPARADGERRGPPRGDRPMRPDGERRGPPRRAGADGERRGPGPRGDGEGRGPRGDRPMRPDGERRGPPRGAGADGERRGPGPRGDGEGRGPRGDRPMRPDGERRGPPRGAGADGERRGPGPRGDGEGRGPGRRAAGQAGRPDRRKRGDGTRAQGGSNRFGSSFPRSFEEFVQESGPIPDNFTDVLDVDFAKEYAPSLEAFQTRYQQVLDFHPGYGTTEEEHEMFLRRLRWGHNFYRFVRFIRTFGSISAIRNPDHPDSEKVLRLADQIKERVIMPDMTEVLDKVEEGRSISFIGIHQGYHWLNKAAKDLVTLPRVHITKSGEATPIGDDIVFKASDADPTAFLKLIKDIRKRQVMIELHPDGRNGELVRKPLFNSEVDIGKGFTTLTWHSKAALYSLGTNWDGENFNIEVKKEPDPKDFEDSEAFTEAALDAYVEICKTAYLEIPENLRLPRLVAKESQ